MQNCHLSKSLSLTTSTLFNMSTQHTNGILVSIDTTREILRWACRSPIAFGRIKRVCKLWRDIWEERFLVMLSHPDQWWEVLKNSHTFIVERIEVRSHDSLLIRKKIHADFWRCFSKNQSEPCVFLINRTSIFSRDEKREEPIFDEDNIITELCQQDRPKLALEIFRHCPVISTQHHHRTILLGWAIVHRYRDIIDHLLKERHLLSVYKQNKTVVPLNIVNFQWIFDRYNFLLYKIKLTKNRW